MHKNALFLLKNRQTLGAPPSYLQWPPAAGASDPRPPPKPLH